MVTEQILQVRDFWLQKQSGRGVADGLDTSGDAVLMENLLILLYNILYIDFLFIYR